MVLDPVGRGCFHDETMIEGIPCGVVRRCVGGVAYE